MQTERIYFHIDVNSAFLSWSAVSLLETGSTVDLRDIPSIIGGNDKSRHGIILAASIPAKKLGITTGEPLSMALRKCPHLRMEPPNHQLYEAYSQKFIHFLSIFTSDIEQLSIDECFLDFTPISSFYSSPLACAQLIQDTIYQELGFTVNIGISTCKVLAKMASDFEKPQKIHTLYPHEIEKKMWSLPISSLYMCGKSSQKKLHNLGIITIKDLALSHPDIIKSHLHSNGLMLWEYANGIDSSPLISTPSKRKGVGNSITLAQDIHTTEEAYKILLALADSVGQRLRQEDDLAYQLSIEIKYNTFQSVSHQTTLTNATNSTQIIYTTSCTLFDHLWNKSPIRLLGLRSTKLESANAPQQLDLFSISPKSDITKQKNLDHTLDVIRAKYGPSAILRGSLLNAPDTHFNKKHKK